ncbi:MAG TPA: dihydroneopterin aldolase [Actinomycetota bacterium]|nr:dihydroneopterin aldolase [Actinomycetota bacterium]
MAPVVTLSVEGIRAQGRHGVNPEERVEPQEFVVDVDAWVEVEVDSIEGTVDYRRIAEVVRRTVETTSFQLLESLARAVAEALLELEPVLQVDVAVHKPRAARSLGVEDVVAQVTLER